jgi:hypothetical protein
MLGDKRGERDKREFNKRMQENAKMLRSNGGNLTAKRENKENGNE